MLVESTTICESRSVLNAIERRFRLIEILLYRRYEKTENLAFELGVSTKTIQRDLLEINTIIPIYSRTGKYYGGIYLREGFSIYKAFLTEEEVVLLSKIKEYILSYKSKGFSKEEVNLLERIIEKHSIPK